MTQVFSGFHAHDAALLKDLRDFVHHVFEPGIDSDVAAPCLVNGLQGDLGMLRSVLALVRISSAISVRIAVSASAFSELYPVPAVVL